MIMVDDYMLFGVHSPFTGAGDIQKVPVSPVDVASTRYSHHPPRLANVTPIQSDLRQRKHEDGDTGLSLERRRDPAQHRCGEDRHIDPQCRCLVLVDHTGRQETIRV
jgi:hypothetical protein